MFGGTEGVCFHTNSLHKDSFCYIGKSKLGIGQFIHELLREPLISDRRRSNDEQMNFRRDVAAIPVTLIKNEGIEYPSEVLNRTAEEV